MKSRTLTRSYSLRCYPNRDKFDTTRYFINRYNLYVNYCIGRQFFNSPIKSTEGLGHLFNKANYNAKKSIKRQRAASKVTGNKINVPNIIKARPLVNFKLSKRTKFDFILSIPNLLTSSKTIKIPVKSTKVLNKALKNGWKTTSFSEVYLKNNQLYVTVFVQKEVDTAKPSKECIGVDVGIKKSIVTSEGYKGTHLSPIISKFKASQAERYRQRMKFGQKQTLKKNTKTYIKQILNKEAKLVIARCLASGSSLAVESRKVLNNLKSGRNSLWARNHFANRCETLAKEHSVFFVEVNPYQTSQTCSECFHVDRNSRDGEKFKCTSCGKQIDADLNAAKVISHRGRQVILEKMIPLYCDQDVEKSWKMTEKFDAI